LNKIRLEEAKRLLSETNSTVAYAAEQSGFRDTCYFSTLFKRYTGTTPSAYKKDMVRIPL
ncbi:MAG: helix-turn-helix transcriptional regulator, partial [Oscillospiraceae bacterium]|nr:helix-turn-helix transcriptional regulator [Oscillospiraceae bacterium]